MNKVRADVKRPTGMRECSQAEICRGEKFESFVGGYESGYNAALAGQPPIFPIKIKDKEKVEVKYENV